MNRPLHSFLTVLTTAILAGTGSAFLSSPVDAAPAVERHAVYLTVVGKFAYIPGEVPASCEPDWLATGQRFEVLDARTGGRIGRGKVGSCALLVDTEPVCAPGLGCLPALVAPIWQLNVKGGGIPTEGIKAYTLKFHTRTYTVAQKTLAQSGWKYELGDAERRR